MQERWAIQVPCHDHAGRERQATVTITDDNQVALIVPAGDAAVWHPVDLNRLKQALTDAQVEAIHRRGGAR